MSSQIIQELRALLDERGPALFLDLVPLLPEAALLNALSLAEQIRDADLRNSVLLALADRLPDDERARVMGRLPILPWDIPPSSPERLRRILGRAPEGEREVLFDKLLDNLAGMIQTKKSAKPPGRGTPTSTTRGSKGGAKGGGRRPRPPSGSHRKKNGGGAYSKIYVPKGDPEPPPFGGGFGGGFGSGGFEAAEGGGAPAERRGGGAAAPKADARTAARKIEDYVNLGFVDKRDPDGRLDKKETLESGKSYLFFLEVGEKQEGSIADPTIRLGTEFLPAEAKLKVALFAFEDGLKIVEGQDVGELQLKDGAVTVSEQPMKARALPRSNKLGTRLFFPVKVPPRPGVFRLRCSIYCEQNLVQSHLISVVAQSTRQKVNAAFFKKERALFTDDSPLLKSQKALYSNADFVLSRTLNPATMPRTPHRLSLMFNSNGSGTHGFFFGRDGKEIYKRNASFTEGQLGSLINAARRAMHKASWGQPDPWDRDKGWQYRYEKETFDLGQLAKDLARLAVDGTDLYAGITGKLATDIDWLARLMAEPGVVQIALKQSAAHVFPAALIYDYPFDSQQFPIETTDYKLCQTFEAALRDKLPLEDCVCFKGKCWLMAEHNKSQEDLTADIGPYVCPSGFWGYRHSLGFPLTIEPFDGDAEGSGGAPAQKAADAPEEMVVGDVFEAVAGVSTDFDVKRRLEHEKVLEGLRAPTNWQRVEARMDFLRLLKKVKPHLIYFYCHGGVKGNAMPYIQIGKTDNIDTTNILREVPMWDTPRPLIFINGCHTTAVTPEVALNFVEFFVQRKQASGVIGTEITIFEPLARDFAEDCLRRFLGGVPIGEAVRGARLALLKRGNPLGLVYIPFVNAGLRLVKK